VGTRVYGIAPHQNPLSTRTVVTRWSLRKDETEHMLAEALERPDGDAEPVSPSKQTRVARNEDRPLRSRGVKQQGVTRATGRA
jgi:hypothetical protein